MNRVVAHLLARLYPRHWRNRYGLEFEALLQSGPGDLRTFVNVVWAALWEHIVPTQGLKVAQHPESLIALMKRPSAFLPMAMSITAMVIALGDAVGIFGIAPGSDEDAAAHIWQFLMAGLIPIVAFFAVKWLRRTPRQALIVLALQAGGVLASVATVFFLGEG